MLRLMLLLGLVTALDPAHMHLYRMSRTTFLSPDACASTRLFEIWAVLFLGALVLIFSLSGAAFYALYWNPRFETWMHKLDPSYPPVSSIRNEILTTLSGALCATLPPALALVLRPVRQAPAIGAGGGMGMALLTLCAVALLTDLYEWAYHRLGHLSARAYVAHRAHHAFNNPSPFSVIADSAQDQICRALPFMIWLLLGVDQRLVALYGALTYAYGVCLHTGHQWLGPHRVPGLLTPYHHWYHHAQGGGRTPIYTGFMILWWDTLAGATESAHNRRCRCITCGEPRSRKDWELARPPQKRPYAELLQWRTWC